MFLKVFKGHKTLILFYPKQAFFIFKPYFKEHNHAKYGIEIESGILQLIKDIADGRIEIKAHNSKNYIQNFTFFFHQISTNTTPMVW